MLREKDRQEKVVNKNKVLPITIRSFETLIRLSTAHAKLHGEKEIQIRDCIEAFRLMIYCLEGDSYALDGDVKEILRKIGLEHTFVFEKPQDKNKRYSGGSRKDNKRMDEESHGLINKMSKIDINRDEKEAEAVIKRAMAGTTDFELKKTQKSLVFKAIAELKNKSKVNKGGISLKDLREKLDESLISN